MSNITKELIILSAIIAMFSGAIIPFIFGFYIRPKIEKRLGKKFAVTDFVTRFSPVSRMSRGAPEMMLYIFIKYLILKATGKSSYKIKYLSAFLSTFALDKVGYKIEDAQKIEIFMSCLVFVDIAIVLVCFLLLYYKIVA